MTAPPEKPRNAIESNTSGRDQKFEKFRKRIEFFAIGLGLGHLKDEIASEAILMRLEGLGQKQNAFHAAVDAARRLGWGTRSGGMRDPLLRRMEPENEEKALATFARHGQADPLDFIHFEQTLQGLEGEDRCLIVLRHWWEFTEEEIGYVFGVSESRICQRLKEMHAQVKRQLPKQFKVRGPGTEPGDDEKSAFDKAKEKAWKDKMRERAREREIDQILFEKHRRREQRMEEIEVEDDISIEAEADEELPVIESGVPIPEGYGAKKRSVYYGLIEKMQLNQSVLVSEAVAKKLTGVGKNQGKKMATRKDPSGKARVWYVGPYVPKAKAETSAGG